MPELWVSCPNRWSLVDVQAALNVVVTTLSFLISFAFIRNVWQRSTKQVAKGKEIPLYTLLTINTPGEVLDTIILLQRNLLNFRYVSICAQCLVVIAFTLTAMFSGPIVRVSSRSIYVPQPRKVPGLLTTNITTSTIFLPSILWNFTYRMLDDARFPEDQLLDFLPDNGFDWTYNPNEWDDGWTMDCQKTTNASISVVVAGNCTVDSFQGVYTRFNMSRWPSSDLDYTYIGEGTGFGAMLSLYSNDYVLTNGSERSMDFVLGVVRIHTAASTNPNAAGSTCPFAQGPVDSASYSSIECKLTSSVDPQNATYHAQPYLDRDEEIALLTGLVQYFALDKTPLPSLLVPSSDELARFYQVWKIVKDVAGGQPTTRTLSVRTPLVQLSLVFVVICALVITLILLGVINIAVFIISHRRGGGAAYIPQSKLDWMIQSIEAEDRPIYNNSEGAGMRKSVTVDPIVDSQSRSSSYRQRAEFEAAIYGGRETTTWFASAPSTTLAPDNLDETYKDGDRESKQFLVVSTEAV